MRAGRWLILLAVAAAAAFAILRPDRGGGKGEGADGAPLASVEVPELSARAEAGKAAFNKSCASCHGADAGGRDGFGPPLVHPIYEPSHHGDAAFFLAAKSGVRAHHWPFGNMPPVEGVTENAVADIVVYVRELQRANGIL